MTDLTLSDHGSIFLLTPQSDAGREWVNDYLPEDFNGAIEPRYVPPIYEAMVEFGLEVELVQ